MSRIESTNDFVIKFANVNGSGSASANELFARAVLRMGVPVSPRNIFPSNIQGLPTWYELRVCEQGWLGRRGGVDLMVAMNPQTWAQDLKEIEPGGYLFYDSTKPPESLRSDVHAIGMPLTAICNGTYEDPRQRTLYKNIMAIGALAELMSVELDVVEKLLGEQYKGKEKLLDGNVRALKAGASFAREHLADQHPVGLKVKRADQVGERIFAEGNAATALGMVYGGATVCAWYPITPSTSVAEAFTSYCKQFRTDAERPEDGKRHAIVQAEDEIAAIGMILGAGWNGARAFTATSGPGVSLMTEFLGFAYFAEVPLTIVNVQRGGPSTGMPTRTQQADLLACAQAGHGDTQHVLLFPEDPRECFDMAADALDLADRLQTPVFVMSDLDIGMNQRLCRPFEWNDERRMDRGKLLRSEDLEAGKEFARYKDLDGDALSYRTLPGTHPKLGSYFTRGSTHNLRAEYSERGDDYLYIADRLVRKMATAARLAPQPLLRKAAKPTRLGVLYFGSTSPAMDEALALLAAQGLHIDACRLRAFPFADAVRDFIDAHDTVFVCEQNRDAQCRQLLITQFEPDPRKLKKLLHFDGTPITARFIAKGITQQVLELASQP